MISNKRLWIILVILVLLNLKPVLSDVLINEIMYNPSSSQGSDTDLEWIELYNNGTATVNLTGWTIDDTVFDSINISPDGYVVIAKELVDVTDNESFESYYGNNDTVWNSTDASYNASDGTFSLTNAGDTINLSNGSYIHLVNYTDFTNLADGNGKTLIWYNGNWTESRYENGTPGSLNDEFPPSFNSWILPSSNNEFITGSINITANITDVTGMDSATVNFNSTNYSMSNTSDIWRYLWDTSNDGSYNITIHYNDTLGYSNTTTLTNITVDNTLPAIDFTSGSNNSYFSRDWIYIDVTVTETNLDEISFYLYNSSLGLVNNASYTNGTSYVNFTSLDSNMEYYYNVYARDKANNLNSTETRKLTLDSTSPAVSYAGGTENNATFFNRDWIYVNVSITETNFNNMTFYLYNSTSQLNASDFTALTNAVNFTGLNSNEYYYYNVTLRDKAGNINSVETRNITLDSTPPSVTINTPTEAVNWSTAVMTTILNASVTDQNIQTVLFNVSNASSYLTYNANNNWLNTSFDTRDLTEGQHTITVYAWDYAGNLNSSESTTFTVDNSGPDFFNLTKTPEPSYNNNTVTLNATINDSLTSVSTVWLSGNWSGSWQNITLQTYSFTIGSNNFTNQQTIGYQWYANDTLGNLANSSFQTFTVQNRAPLNTTIPDQLFIEDAPAFTINLSNYFTDPDGSDPQPLSYTSTITSNVTITITNDIASIDSNEDWCGAETVTFTANDSLTATPGNLVTLNATCQNDAPTNEGMASVPSVAFNEDSYNSTLLISDYIYDKDSAIIEYSSYSNDSNLMITILPTNYSYINATQNWNGQAEVYFKARDQEGQWGNSNTFIVNISPINDAPYTNTTPDQINLTESDSQASLDLTPYFADIENTPLSYTITSENEVNCTISGASLLYKPKQYWHGAAECNVTANDTALTSPAQAFTFLVNSTENIPIITTTCLTQTNQSELYTCDINATDGDVLNGEQTLTFSLTEKPSTMVIDAGTGLISWIPDNSYVGSNNIEVKAMDNVTNYDTYSFTINVIDKNDEPPQVTLTSPSNASTIVSATKTAKLDWQNSTDPENQSITYYLFFGNQTSPSLLTTTSSSEYTTSTLNDNSTYYWYIIAGDGTLNSTSSETWQFNTLFDNAPVILSHEPIADPSIAETESILFNATLYDIDQDNITYNWSINGITNLTGTTSSYNETISFTFTSDYNSSANSPYAIKLEIKDTNNNTGTSNSWTAVVANTNRAPVLSSIPNQLVNEDSLLTFNITASDPDLIYGDSLTYSSNLTPLTIQKINNTLASVSWTPTNNYIGNNTINFTVTDGLLTDSQTVTLTVTNTNDAPTLNSIGSLTAYEDTAFTYDVNATDSDTGDSLTFYDNTSLFNISPSTGIISFTPVESDIGTYYINITVEDSSNASDTEIITLTISNTNDAPTLSSIPDQSVNEDSLLTFNITASDPDLIYGDSLTYSSNLTPLTIQKINNTFAIATWTPTNDYVGDNTINFTVTDGLLTDSQTITLTVINTNDAPTISTYHPIFNPKIADINGLQQFNVTASDIDIGDALNITWYFNNTLAATGASYSVTGLPAGNYNVTAVVTDGSLSTSHYWDLTVSNTPISNKYTGTFELLNSSQLDNATNVTIESQEGKIDFGNTTLNLSDTVDLDNYINISTGIIGIDTTKLPALNKPAKIVLEGLSYAMPPIIYYNEGFGVSGTTPCPSDICTDIVYASGALTFNVAHFSTYWTAPNTTNSAPIITSSPATSAFVSQEYTYDIDASDQDGDTLEYSLTTSPSGMSINNNTGLITWTPSSTGNYAITAIVSDNDLTDTQSFTLTVSEEKRAKLAIADLDVNVNGEKDTNLNTGNKINDPAEPGSTVEFKLKIENLYSDEEGLDIEDITAEIILENIDDGDDLEEETDEFDLDAGDTQKETLSFEIPLEVDEDDYTARIIVEGKDENGTYHRIEWRLTLEVEKKTHEVIITEAVISPSISKCKENIAFRTEIMNIGSRDEDDVSIEITNRDLGLDITETGIELDKDLDDDNSFEKTYYFKLPDELAAETYPINYKVYYDNKLSDTKTENLVIKECKQVKTGSAAKVELISGPSSYPPSYAGAGIAVAQPMPERSSVLSSFSEPENLVLILAVLFMFVCVIAVLSIILAIVFKRR